MLVVREFYHFWSIDMKLAKMLMGLSIVFVAMNTQPVKSWSLFARLRSKCAVAHQGQKPNRSKAAKKRSRTKHSRSSKSERVGFRAQSASDSNVAPEALENSAVISFNNPINRIQHVIDAKIRAEQMESQRLAARAVDEFMSDPVELVQMDLQPFFAPAESAGNTGEQVAA